MTWVIGILGYACLLALVLLFVGGVRRGDALHQRSAQDLASGDAPQRPSAPPRQSRGLAGLRRRSATR